MTTQNKTTAYVLPLNEAQKTSIDAAHLKKLITQTPPKPNIPRGSRVEFDKDGATLTGTIFHFTSNIENGRKMAVIELEHELPGVTETVPFDQLRAAPLSHNIVYLSGDFDCLKPEANDRRFYVIPGIDRQANINTNDCAKIIALVAHLCNFKSQLINQVLCWLAYPLQNEGKKNPTALMFQQESGCGISLFFGEVMRPIYLDQFIAVYDYDLSRQFNGWAKGKRLVLCEEVVLGKHFQILAKSLISSPTITINERMQAPQVLDDQINYAFTCKQIPSELTTQGSRRFIFLHPTTASDDSFYTDVYSEIKLGGIEAFRKYLLSLDLTEYNRSFGCV